MHRRRRKLFDEYKESLEYFQAGDAFFLAIAVLLIVGAASSILACI